MDMEVRRYLDEYGSTFETLAVDGVKQFKIGPINFEDPLAVTCEKLGLLIERAWDNGIKKEPMVPIYIYEENRNES